MMESRIGNLKSPVQKFPDSAAGPGVRVRGFLGLVPRRPPHANTATRSAHCGHGAPSTLRLPAVRAAGF